MKKKFLAIVIVLSMLLSVVPMGMISTIAATTQSDVTITVLDKEGNNVTDSNLSVSVTHVYGTAFNRNEAVTVTNYGDGVFGYESGDYNRNNTKYYQINANLTVDGKTYTASSQVAKNVTSVVLTLKDFVQSDKWARFDVYYIADGHFPESFYGYGAPEEYGPAGDDTPLLSINVNITKLQSYDSVLYQQNIKNTDPDTYNENIGNAYHFIPAKISDSTDEKEAYTENVAYAKAFWDAVVECMDQESIDAFDATGLFDKYIVYCLKNQGSAANPDNHADGILVANIDKEDVTPIIPPVYVVEMYDHQGHIFGGYTDDSTTISENPTTMDDVLDAYKKHFGQDITWQKDTKTGVWNGSYYVAEDGKNYRYDLKMVQTNVDLATDYTSSTGTEPDKIVYHIKYQAKTDTYYLATFQSEAESRVRVDYTVTYTDGVKDRVFDDQVTSVNSGDPVVAFDGNSYREDHTFLGWTLQGGDGTVLSQQDILNTYKSVDQDLTFVAIYMVTPKYAGTVEVILDGYYDSSDATATGTKIDITEILGENISIYVSADGTEFIPLVRKDKGVYSATLENGDYGIYYYDGSEYTLSSDQHLSINNADRTRYLFFEQVVYNLNGGVGGPEKFLEYYHTGAQVNVSKNAPTKEGYIFAGWKDQDGKLYNSGDILTSAIGKTYNLTAQWVDAADIYVNVTINHGSEDAFDNTNTKDDISFDLVYSPDVNTPYLETGDSFDLSVEEHAGFDYNCEPKDADNASVLKTVYTASVPTVADAYKDYLYSVVVSKHHYDVASINTKPTENGDIVIEVVLDYAPENRDLEFEVKVADDVPESLIPQAAIVKVLYWSAETNSWDFIHEHKNTNNEIKPGVRVNIGSDRVGTGLQHVWGTEVLEDNITRPYGYRMVVTALVYPDGNIVAVNQDVLENLTANNTDIYNVTLNAIFEDGDASETFGELNGAYFVGETQNGTLNAVITADAYNVTFDAKGGKVNGKDEDIATNQYKVPEFDAYVATRDGGYVFDGWYKDEDFKVSAVEGEYLNSDITLYAKWKAPLEVKGLVTVGATYEQEGENGTSIHKIPETSWAKTVLVMLQRVEPNGYTETIREVTLDLDYTNAYYYNGDRIVGFANYSFGEIPDVGLNYRIQVLLPNHHSTFQNEDESLTNALNYYFYTHDHYIANFGQTDPNVAVVNAHTHFSPEEFELNYSVNAEAIGEGFKPLNTEVLITSDDYKSGAVPSNWPVISQMVFDDEFIGDNVAITNGKGSDSEYVWIRRPDGVSIYEYGIRIEDVVLADGTTAKFSDDMPFTIEYQAPAYYTENGQSDELIATLIPKTYVVDYETNGGSLSGNYPTEHTWSYETSIAGIVPTFDGFKFAGWYLDKDLTIPAGDTIDASVAANTTLYAKWIQVMDTVDLTVTINHRQLNTESGLASNYDKTLYAQLTYADRNVAANEQVFADMVGYAKEYPNGQWHTHGNNVEMDIFEVPKFYTNLTSEYDYGVNVTLEGYYVSEKTVEKVDQPDGSTLHKVNVTLQFDPDLFDVEFYVQMADGVSKDVYPKSAEIKVTSWYDDPAADTDWDWIRITQHETTTVTVSINPETGYGEGSYPVFHWYDEVKQRPYVYRMEVIQLNFADGTTLPMEETLADVSYSGGGYNAEIKVENGRIPQTANENQSATTLSGVYATGKHYEEHTQVGTVGAIIDVNKIVFHTNNEDANVDEDDTFRTYYPVASASTNKDVYTLNEDGTITSFYEIPEFEYETHNKYIFKGWYLDKDSEENPLDWDTVYTGTTHVYAHWIQTGTVAKEDDGKYIADDSYVGFDLIGVQIREKEIDSKIHYGNPSSGLRFITALSEDVYTEINAIEGNGSGAEYGFVLARASAADRNAGDDANYTLQYKDKNVNGVDTSSSYSYVQNFKCSGVDDHYESENYRLYTVVITFNNLEGDDLEAAYNDLFMARSYLRYYDANGMLRVHYNNYTGKTHFYGGCKTSFAAIRDGMAN